MASAWHALRCVELTLVVSNVNTSSSVFSFDVTFETTSIRIFHIELGTVGGGAFRNVRSTDNVISGDRFGQMDLVNDIVDLLTLHLHFNSGRQELITGGIADLHDALIQIAGHGHHTGTFLLDYVLDHLLRRDCAVLHVKICARRA